MTPVRFPHIALSHWLDNIKVDYELNYDRSYSTSKKQIYSM